MEIAMTSPIKLIVGLANPGDKYKNTRHNAGAWFVEEIIANYCAEINKSSSQLLKPEKKFHGLFGSVDEVDLLIPTTYMNDSGLAVHACAKYNKILPEAILVAHDDLDLPVGTVKLKFDGGDGGHNGVHDIINHLHTKQFHRLRIGIGRPQKETIDYVLEPPSKADRQLINDAIKKACDVLPLLLAGEISKATQQLHT